MRRYGSLGGPRDQNRCSMTRTMTFAALTLAALALAGCGGGGASPTPGSAAPPSSAGVSTGSAAADTPSASASSSSTGSGTATIADPCTVLSAGQVAKLTGVQVKKGATQTVGGSTVCSWAPQDGTKADAAVFSAQEGPLTGSLSQVEDQLKAEFGGGKVSTITVAGADDARYVTGTKSGLNIIDVLAQKDQVFYQVLVATPRDAARHKTGAVKITEALLAH